MVYSLGNVSGAHLNPAVTVALYIARRPQQTEWKLGLYPIFQFFAAACASFLYPWFHAAGPYKSETFGLSPGAGYTLVTAGLAELLFTFVLCYVVMCTASVQLPESSRTKLSSYVGLSIGSCVTLGGF